MAAQCGHMVGAVCRLICKAADADSLPDWVLRLRSRQRLVHKGPTRQRLAGVFLHLTGQLPPGAKPTRAPKVWGAPSTVLSRARHTPAVGLVVVVSGRGSKKMLQEQEQGWVGGMGL